MDNRIGVTLFGVLRVWILAFIGNFLGAISIAFMMAIVFTFGFSTDGDNVGKVIARIGEDRTIGYKENGLAGNDDDFYKRGAM